MGSPQVDKTGGEFTGPSMLSSSQPDIFAHLTESEFVEVMEVPVHRTFNKGEMLFTQGNRHEGVYLIKSGLVKTFYLAPTGREFTLAYWKAGNVCGTPEVVGTGRKMWSGSAVYETKVLAFSASQLRELMARHPGLAMGMIEALEYKAQCISEMLQLVGTCTVPQRIKHVLHTLAEQYGIDEDEGIRLERPFTHEAIAEMAGASRQWVTAIVDELQYEEILRMEGRRLIILKPDELF